MLFDNETVRHAVLIRDQYACQRCFDRPKRLEVHHWLPMKNKGRYDFDNLVTLCHRCHWIVEIEYRRFHKYGRTIVGGTV